MIIESNSWKFRFENSSTRMIELSNVVPLIKEVEVSNPKITKELTGKINVAGISDGDYESLKKEIRLVIDVLDGKIET